MQKKILFLFLLLYSSSILSQKITIPRLESSVTDLTETLTKNELFFLKSKLNAFEKDSIGQIVVLLIPTTGDESIEEFSIRLAEIWKVGSAENDDGVILIIAKNDRKLRIEVGYGPESEITDADAGQIINNVITPEFKNGDFYNGINNGLDAIIAHIKSEESIVVSETEYSEDEVSEENSELSVAWILVSIFVMMVSMIVPFFFIKRSILFYLVLLIVLTGTNYFLGHLIGNVSMSIFYSLIGGLTIGIIIFVKLVAFIWGKRTGNSPASFFGSGSGSNSSSSLSWSSSSSSYSGGSSSYSSGSSYSGGGGSFGGGGASGSW